MEGWKIILIIVGIILLYILIVRNKFVKLKNSIKNAKSTIDVYLKQRFDLIPNLIEVVKGYSKHEEEVFITVVEARNDYLNSMSLKDATTTNEELNKLIALAESYPDLKASEQFLHLQKQLVKMENQLQAARRVYNSEVEVYNNAIMVVPSNILAKLFGYKAEKYFELSNAEEANNVEVKL